MGYLSAVTLLWAFSFSLIGVYLAGQVDAWFSVLTRVSLAALLFLPFLRRQHLNRSLALKIMLVGAFQLGIMYCFYYQSFLYLSVPEVLLFHHLHPDLRHPDLRHAAPPLLGLVPGYSSHRRFGRGSDQIRGDQ